jgi:hypothetical protein
VQGSRLDLLQCTFSRNLTVGTEKARKTESRELEPRRRFETGTHWIRGWVASDPFWLSWRREKSHSSAVNSTQIPRSPSVYPSHYTYLAILAAEMVSYTTSRYTQCQTAHAFLIILLLAGNSTDLFAESDRSLKTKPSWDLISFTNQQPMLQSSRIFILFWTVIYRFYTR